MAGTVTLTASASGFDDCLEVVVLSEGTNRHDICLTASGASAAPGGAVALHDPQDEATGPASVGPNFHGAGSLDCTAP